MGQDQSGPIVDENVRPQTLDSRTIEAVAKLIKDGRVKKIVVMTGAGISTSAGIPDFRSPDTGLYSNLARLNLPYAEAVFDISYFRNNPLPFYILAQELYPGKYRPTITHSFLYLLHKKGLLLKLFTQNIDCLEREAGLPGDMIVEAHGSFAKQSCIECKTPYPRDSMEQAIHDKTVPHCLEKNCDGLVKPEIVFFGEQLPADFFNNKDLPSQADLCIVLGTSLSVQPFASLPGLCQEHTPRVLINQEQVGSLGSRADDVLVLGDCDSGVRKLAKACGWLEELEQLWAETVPDQTPTASKDEPAKSKDEALQDEVDQLTKEVEQTLKLGEAQHKWLENHLDNKAARVQEVNKRPTPTEQATREPDGPTTSELETTMRPEALKVEPESEENGLEHVFPHMNKKPSL